MYAFLTALEARLSELTADQVREALLAHAEHLVPRERAAFLAIFTEMEHEPDRRRALDERAEGHLLIGEIDAFIVRLRSGAYVDGWGWDDEIREERALVTSRGWMRWTICSAAASDAFLEGDMELAREALGSLLERSSWRARLRLSADRTHPI